VPTKFLCRSDHPRLPGAPPQLRITETKGTVPPSDQENGIQLLTTKRLRLLAAWKPDAAQGAIDPFE